MVITNCRRRRLKQIVLSHQPQHPLVIHHPTFAFQQPRDPTVAVIPIFQRQPLDSITHRHVFFSGFSSLPSTVITRTADSGQLTHLEDVHAALHLLLLFDYFEDAAPPLSFFLRLDASTRRKACSKKSISSCCRPTNRSSSATRFSGSRAGFLLRGRPISLKPAAPLFLNRLRHRDSSASLIFSCRATTDGRSPFSTRSIAATLNSTGYSRRPSLVFLMNPLLSPIVHFLCLSFGVHSSGFVQFEDFKS